MFERELAVQALQSLRHVTRFSVTDNAAIARGHRDYFAAIAPLSAECLARFELAASESIARQQEVEASDTISLDEYLATYFSSE